VKTSKVKDFRKISTICEWRVTATDQGRKSARTRGEEKLRNAKWILNCRKEIGHGLKGFN
jgi:hypothetical protein